MLFACGKRNPYPDLPLVPATETDNRFVPQGSLGEMLVELRENPDWLEPCDLKVSKKQEELISVLDNKSAEIALHVKSKVTSGASISRYHHEYQLGNFQFLVRDESFPIAPAEWDVEIQDSWEEIYQLYTKIKDSPVDNNWLYINSVARSLMFDDKERIIYGTNLHITRKQKELLKSLASEINQCALKSGECEWESF